jgi:DNA-binding response OmpR family regulator
MPRILVVEDEAHIAEGLQFNLEAEGYEVELAGDGQIAVDLLTREGAGYDLVILDLMLPGIGGFQVVRRMRASGNLTPVLILTAKDDPEDVVRGLEDGADDYLAKPFRLEELLARVRGVLRRRRWDGAVGGAGALRSVQVGDATIHFDRFEVESGERRIQLTTKEAALLRVLVEREGEAVPRGDLLQEVWGLRPDTRTRVVDSFIVRLRRYLEPDPAHPRHIVSVRGHGYRFVR